MHTPVYWQVKLAPRLAISPQVIDLLRRRGATLFHATCLKRMILIWKLKTMKAKRHFYKQRKTYRKVLRPPQYCELSVGQMHVFDNFRIFVMTFTLYLRRLTWFDCSLVETWPIPIHQNLSELGPAPDEYTQHGHFRQVAATSNHFCDKRYFPWSNLARSIRRNLKEIVVPKRCGLQNLFGNNMKQLQ